MAKPTRAFGLQPSKNRDGGSGSGVETYALTGAAGTGTVGALHNGDPVKVSNGLLQQAPAGNAIGVFRGGAFIDSNTGYLQFKSRIPSGQASGNGNVEGYPYAIGYVEEFNGRNDFVVVCDTSIQPDDVGWYYSVSVSAADEVGTTLGISSYYLAFGSKVTVPSATARYQLMGPHNIAGNEFGVTSPQVIVRPVQPIGVITSAI